MTTKTQRARWGKRMFPEWALFSLSYRDAYEFPTYGVLNGDTLGKDALPDTRHPVTVRAGVLCMVHQRGMPLVWDGQRLLPLCCFEPS